MSHSIEIIVFAEDEPQQKLLRAALKRLKLDRRLTIEPVVLGQNDDWVTQQLHREVPLLRKKHHLRAVIAVTDADEKTVAQRKSELDAGLEVPRTADELIVYIIPRRNIETWIWYLQGHSVDEKSNYKKRSGGSVTADQNTTEVRRYFAEYIETGREPFPACPPSLQDARIELNRLRNID